MSRPTIDEVKNVLRLRGTAVKHQIGLLPLTMLLFITPAAAQSGGSDVSCPGMPEQLQNIAELLTRIQELGIALGVLIASIMIIYGGILWMRGTPDSQQKARRIIFNSLVGLTIVLISGGLVEFVKSILGCGGV